MKPQDRIARIRELIEGAERRTVEGFPFTPTLNTTQLELTVHEFGEICQLVNVGKPRKHNVKAIA